MMQKKMIAFGCAAMLALTLVGCNTTTKPPVDDTDKTDPARTGRSVYETNENYTARTRAANRNTLNNGRYTAYGNGTVSPGHGTLARDARNLAGDVGRVARNAAYDVETAIDRMA